VLWRPRVDELREMARAYAAGERELEFIEAMPSGPFRFLVVKRNGRWFTGGMLPSNPDNHDSDLINVH
jgi:hypothetical protein